MLNFSRCGLKMLDSFIAQNEGLILLSLIALAYHDLKMHKHSKQSKVFASILQSGVSSYTSSK